MEHLSIHFLKHFILEHAVIIYFIIIIGVLVEGEMVVLLSGVFVSLKSLNPFLALIAIVLGALSKTFIAYSVGSYFSNNHSNNAFVRKVENRICAFIPHFDRKPFFSIFISRFLLLGMAWFTLIYSGFKKINFKTYIKAELSSLFIWAPLTLALGYFFGNTALSISRDVRNFIILILSFLFIFFILEKLVAFIVELFALGKVEK